MKTAAVIAECNPFQKGHEYLIRRVREETGADRILLLLSGDYVQRGLPAVTERRVRAEMALRCGADLVLSYPTRYATSSAEAFAYHAVSMIVSLGCADVLAFGSECGDLGALKEAAAFFLDESEKFKENIRANLQSGDTFAAARAKAAGKYAALIGSPNNILAVEYLKALAKTGSGMEAYTVKRAAYADISASRIRTQLAEGGRKDEFSAGKPEKEIGRQNAANAIPPEACELLRKDLSVNGMVQEDDYSLLLHDRILRADTADDLTKYHEVTPALAGSILSLRKEYRGFEAFASALHTKNRTHSAVNRALLHIALGIEKSEKSAYFTQILGFRTDAGELMKKIAKSSSVPVVAKAANAAGILDPDEMSLFREEMRVCDLFEGIRAGNAGRAFQPEIAKSPVKAGE